jgi:hypothetical protein
VPSQISSEVCVLGRPCDEVRREDWEVEVIAGQQPGLCDIPCGYVNGVAHWFSWRVFAGVEPSSQGKVLVPASLEANSHVKIFSMLLVVTEKKWGIADC